MDLKQIAYRQRYGLITVYQKLEENLVGKVRSLHAT